MNLEKNLLLRTATVCLLSVCAFALGAQSTPAGSNVLENASSHQPFHLGVVAQGGNGLTDHRGGFHFAMAGFEAGRVLTNNFGKGIFRGNFEYAVQLYPYWQAFTPTFDRIHCIPVDGSTTVLECTNAFKVGGTYSGVSAVPVILRWNFARHGRVVPWAQAAGGLLWTNHKFPAYGNTVVNLNVNGPNGETSVWNFTPQGGIGFHYFTRANRSLDFSANGVHTSSASLGDRNPGVNAGVQFSVGYSWWK